MGGPAEPRCHGGDPSSPGDTAMGGPAEPQCHGGTCRALVTWGGPCRLPPLAWDEQRSLALAQASPRKRGCPRTCAAPPGEEQTDTKIGGHAVAPMTGSSLPQVRWQSRDAQAAPGRGLREPEGSGGKARRAPQGPRVQPGRRRAEHHSQTRRTTGVLSEKGRAAARTATQGGWPGGRRTAPQPGPSCLTFTQRSDNCSPPAHAESTLPAGHPPSWAVRQQSSLWQLSLQHPAQAARPLAQRWHLPFLHLAWPRAGPQQKASPTLLRKRLRRAGPHGSRHSQLLLHHSQPSHSADPREAGPPPPSSSALPPQRLEPALLWSLQAGITPS